MDTQFMKMAIREAKKGIGRTSPNPAVGAVVVKDGKVVGKGYHQWAGGAHAEVNALKDAGTSAKDATIYVTLEPCNHHGRTPPCTHAILKHGIKRVVVGMTDPNPSVAGNGNKYLLAQGVDVTSGILEENCKDFNRPFTKFIQHKLPWIILKAGISLDGKIAAHNGQSSWITNEKSRNCVHKLRNSVDAILIGVDTALIDNPSLTCRLPNSKGRDPLRVVLDSHLRMSPDCKMLNQQSDAATLIYCSSDADNEKKMALEKAGAIIQTLKVCKDGHPDLEMVLKDLGKRDVCSVLVEGGSKIHGSFIKKELVDEVKLFIAPILIGDDGVSVVGELGLKSIQECSRLSDIKVRRFGSDTLIEGYF